MKKIPHGSRKLKQYLEHSFKNENWIEHFNNVLANVNKGIVRSLFSLLYNKSELVKWRSVSAFGLYAIHIETNNHEKLLYIVRQCIWMLTEESGGIAWGVPEVIGEILANNKTLSRSHYNILLSYLYENPDGPDNFLDYEPLRVGVLWAVSRLAEVYPDYIRENESIIDQRINEEINEKSIAILCRIIGNAKLDKLRDYLILHSKNHAEILMYLNGELKMFKVSELANSALELI